MDSDQPVVVIGAAGIDIKVHPYAALQMARSNLGHIRNSMGGVARNIAENLARLEVPTILLSAIGQDSTGDWLVRHTSAAGVDMTHVQQLADVNTGSYVALLEPTGQLIVSVSDYDIVEMISPGYLQKYRGLLAEAAMIVIDANLSPRTLGSVFLWANRYNVPVCADPTSAVLSDKLIKYLPNLHMVAPDAIEAAALCGADHPPTTTEEAIASAQCLVAMGVDIAIVTLAEQGLAYADGRSAGQIPALRSAVVDTTGVGDALTAAVIFGLVNDMPLDEAVRVGVSAAALTLRTRETVVPDLSLDRIYDELVV